MREENQAFLPFYPDMLDLSVDKPNLEEIHHVVGYISWFRPRRPPDARTAAPEGGTPNDSAETRNAASAALRGRK